MIGGIPMFEMDVALRHIKSRHRQTLFSVIAVALSVTIIIVSMSMISGFTNNLIDVLVENQAHITISPKETEDYIYLHQGLEDHVREQVGVVAVSSIYQGDAAIEHQHNVEGAMLRGINPQDEDRVMNIQEDIIEGDFYALTGLGNNIIIGFEMARNLEVSTGDTITVQFPGSSNEFRIIGIFRTGTQLDETLTYAHLDRVQDFYNKGDVITGMEVKVADIFAADTLAGDMERETGYDAVSWIEKSGDILELLDTQMMFAYIMYILIFAISGFGIANILVMIVMEKVGEIGMLMAMGTNKQSIRIIFLLEAGILGFIGVVIGWILGYITALVIGSYNIPVPPETYFGLDHLPMMIEFKNFIIAGIFAMVIITLAGFYPANKASKMDPVEAIHSV